MRAALLIVAVTAVTAVNAFGADDGFCFAFMRNGNVMTSCQGREDRITEPHQSLPWKLNSFAVVEDHGVLAGVVSVNWRTGTTDGSRTANGGLKVEVTPGSEDVADIIRMTDLKTGKPRLPAGLPSVWQTGGITYNIPSLVSTCGGLFGMTDRMRHPIPRDLLTGKDVPFDPYTWFRCTADRKTVAGIVEADRILYEGLPPQQTLVAPAGTAAYYEFNMSPNGKYLAYASDRQPLCVWGAEAKQCASADAIDNSHDLVSVRDDGEVLVAMPTSEMCTYKSGTDFAPVTLKGNPPKGSNVANCLGIAHWRAGMKSPEILVPVGRMPQWITPATAELMRAWSRKTHGQF